MAHRVRLTIGPRKGNKMSNDPLKPTNYEKPPATAKELPEIGEQGAVICQVHNVGHETYKSVVNFDPTILIIFELEQKLKGGTMDGKPMTFSHRVPNNFAKGAKGRDLLEAWRGRPYTDDEVQAFTWSKILGKQCRIVFGRGKKENGQPKATLAGLKLAPPTQAVTLTYTTPPAWVEEEKKKNASNVPRSAPQSNGGNQSHASNPDF